MRKPAIAVLLIGLALASCGGGADGDDASGTASTAPTASDRQPDATAPAAGNQDEVVVDSDDGRASLTLPAGSVPGGIDVADVTIEWAEIASDEPGTPDVAVRLLPAGLALNSAGTLRINVPEDTSEQLVAAHMSRDGFELLPVTSASDTPTPSVIVPVEHFSAIAIYASALFTTITRADPPVVTVEQAQTVTIEGWLESPSFSLWITTDHEFEDEWVLYTFDARLDPVASEHLSNTKWGERDDADWDPWVGVGATTVDDVVVTGTTTSVCKQVNTDDPRPVLGVRLDMVVAKVGEPVKQGWLEFSKSFQQVDTGVSQDFDAAQELRFISFAAEVGDEVTGWAWLREAVDSDCVAAAVSDTSTSTTTTTTLPGDGSQPDPEGDNAGSGTSGSDNAADSAASDIVSHNAQYDTDEGCFTFTMRVSGAGKAMAESERSKWYNPRIVVNNDFSTNTFSDGGFQVDIKWSSGSLDTPGITDANRAAIDGATATAEWMDDSTLKVIVKGIEATGIENSRVELSARTQDADGNTVDTFGDDAHWEAN